MSSQAKASSIGRHRATPLPPPVLPTSHSCLSDRLTPPTSRQLHLADARDVHCTKTNPRDNAPGEGVRKDND